VRDFSGARPGTPCGKKKTAFVKLVSCPIVFRGGRKTSPGGATRKNPRGRWSNFLQKNTRNPNCRQPLKQLQEKPPFGAVPKTGRKGCWGFGGGFAHPSRAVPPRLLGEGGAKQGRGGWGGGGGGKSGSWCLRIVKFVGKSMSFGTIYYSGTLSPLGTQFHPIFRSLNLLFL